MKGLVTRALSMIAIVAMSAAAPATADTGDLIRMLTEQLGVSEQQASGGAGALFNLAQSRMQPSEFGQVSEALPGIDGLMAKAPAARTENSDNRPVEKMTTAAGRTGMAGSAGTTAQEAAKGAMGTSVPTAATAAPAATTANSAGGIGGLGSLTGQFSDLGMSPDMIEKFVPVVLDYTKSQGGDAAFGLLQKALLGV